MIVGMGDESEDEDDILASKLAAVGREVKAASAAVLHDRMLFKVGWWYVRCDRMMFQVFAVQWLPIMHGLMVMRSCSVGFGQVSGCATCVLHHRFHNFFR